MDLAPSVVGWVAASRRQPGFIFYAAPCATSGLYRLRSGLCHIISWTHNAVRPTVAQKDTGMATSSGEKQGQVRDQFHTEMDGANVSALWERYSRHDADTPRSEPAFIWPWRDVEPLVDQAVRETGMDTAERRVIQMNNPHFPGQPICATTNINCGFQILMPGEAARPHRHTMNALRFVVEDGGGSGATIVDGKHCPMAPGDMILTPAWTWHEHIHEGDSRVIWLDALDVPIVDHLGAAFFEAGPSNEYPEMTPDSALRAPGLVPVGAEKRPYSPLFRYPWTDACDALDAQSASSDGARRLRYTNPVTGGAVMTLLDCYLIGLAKGQETAPYRTSSNAVCLVVEGEGSSQIGEETIAWGKNDLFTLPHWSWITHRAGAEKTRLFQITDREVLRRLELLWDEGDGAAALS